MNKRFLTTVLGLTSIIALKTIVPVRAEPRIYQIVGGKESLEVNPDTIAILKDKSQLSYEQNKLRETEL